MSLEFHGTWKSVENVYLSFSLNFSYQNIIQVKRHGVVYLKGCHLLMLVNHKTVMLSKHLPQSRYQGNALSKKMCGSVSLFLFWTIFVFICISVNVVNLYYVCDHCKYFDQKIKEGLDIILFKL